MSSLYFRSWCYSRKRGPGVSPRFRHVVFVFGVNQENLEAGGGLKILTIFAKKAPPQMFDRAQDVPLMEGAVNVGV